MDSYQAAHLRPGQGVFFEGEVYGEVQSLLHGFVKIAWKDGTVTEHPSLSHECQSSLYV